MEPDPQHESGEAAASPPPPPPRPTSPRVGLRVAISAILVLLFLALGVGAFLGLKSLRKEASQESALPPRTAVSVEEAQPTTHREILSGYGRARALRSADVAAELRTVVTWIAPELEAGAHVAAGAELVRLDDRDAKAALASADARKLRADAALTRLASDVTTATERLGLAEEELGHSQRELDRLVSIEGSGVTASEVDRQRMTNTVRKSAVASLRGQIDSLSSQKQSAEADRAAAIADVERARADSERTSIRAPYAGVIEERHAELGAHVQPGQVLFRIVDTSRIEVPVTLPASRFGEVRVGTRAAVRLREGGDVVWTGAVARIGSTVATVDRTCSVYLVIEAKDGETPVPPGAFVVAELDGRLEEDVFVVPRSALVDGVVYVIAAQSGDEGDVASKTPNVRRLLPDVALIDGGLEAGDLVVVTNVEQIADGTRVRIVREAQPNR